MGADSVVSTLTGTPSPLHDAVPMLPAASGFYAWWIRPSAFPEVPLTAVDGGELALLYVGIAPARARSGQTIRSRVVGNHIGGNTGSSTFRLSLASLLFEAKGWQPIARGGKVVLSGDDNAQLRRWQEAEMALTWAEQEKPWLLESGVVGQLRPTLNLAGNASHPFHSTLVGCTAPFQSSALSDQVIARPKSS